MNRALLIAGLAILALAGTGAITYAATHALGSTKTETAAVTDTVRRVVIDVDAGDVKLVAGGDRVQMHRTSRYAVRAPKITQRVTTNVGDVALDLARPAAHVDARSDVGDVDVAVPEGTYAVTAGTDVGDREVGGLVLDDRAPRTIGVGSDVGDVTVRAR